MTSHHRLAAVRGHLLEMAGEPAAAIAAYLDAAGRTASTPERRYLLTKAADRRAVLGADSPPDGV